MSAWAKAETIGIALIKYGIELSKASGFEPDADKSEDDQGNEILKDAVPRLMASLKNDGIL